MCALWALVELCSMYVRSFAPKVGQKKEGLWGFLLVGLWFLFEVGLVALI
jgi:hypothetical protein